MIRNLSVLSGQTTLGLAMHGRVSNSVHQPIPREVQITAEISCWHHALPEEIAKAATEDQFATLRRVWVSLPRYSRMLE